MTTVGVRDLKAKLSEYLARAKRGEQIYVTERGKKIAILAPLPAEQVLVESLVNEGQAEWNGKRPNGLRGLKSRGKSMSDQVLEDRD